MTSVISERSAAIDPHAAAVAGQLAEEDGIETVIATVTENAAPKGIEREIGIETVIVNMTEIVYGPDHATEVTTGVALIAAAIEVESGIMVVMTIVLDELGTLDLPPVDAHAHDPAIDIAVGTASVHGHNHDRMRLDDALVRGRTPGGGLGLVADHPRDELLLGLWTSTAMCL